MKVLLVSGYELGQQPLGVAVPAAALAAAGHELRATDLAVDSLHDEDLDWADRVVASVPMHTALQLVLGALARARAEHPRLRFALHGLYAPVAEGHPLIASGDLLVAGDPVPALQAWLSHPRQGPPVCVTDIGPPGGSTGMPPPMRGLLPPLGSYAALVIGEERRVAASTAVSTGCNHKCRHCPVAAVYGGRSRPVAPETVLSDLDQLVAMGAEHITFSDPDFLNRPRRAYELARELHHRWPQLTFDATVKVEHVIRHADLWPEVSRMGLLFVVSAFESRDGSVLRLLDKGHTPGDEVLALGLLRASGIEVRPSWLPFSPWSTLEQVAAILEFSAAEDLVWSTDLVQYSIRLLLPKGSLLLEKPDAVLAAALGDFDPDSGSYSWTSPDPRLDALQLELADVAERQAAGPMTPPEAFEQIWAITRSAGAALDASPPAPVNIAPAPGPMRPHLSEAWFCCAEPTRAQREAVVGRLRAPA